MAQLGTGEPNLHTVNFCIFSHPGEGKTAFWGTGNNKVFILDSDPGMGTQTCEALGQKPYVMPVVDYDDLATAYEYVAHDLMRELPDVTWIVWDSITLFQDRALIDDIMPDAHAANPEKQEEFVPSRREYLINMNRIGRYVRQFVDLNTFNFGCSAHVLLEPTPDGSTMYMPQVAGKNMPSKIAGYMNVVGYMTKREVEGKQIQSVLWQKEAKYYAKDRFSALGHHMDRPTLPKVMELIEAKRGGPVPNRQPVAPPTPVRRPVRRRAVASSSTK